MELAVNGKEKASLTKSRRSLLPLEAPTASSRGRLRVVQHALSGRWGAVICQRTFNRDSPDEPRTVVDFCAFAAFRQDRLAARTIAVILGTPNRDRGADLAILASIWTYSSRQFA
jgi:hypothetical protein